MPRLDYSLKSNENFVFYLNSIIFAESDIRVSTCKFLTNCQTIFSSAKLIKKVHVSKTRSNISGNNE